MILTVLKSESLNFLWLHILLGRMLIFLLRILLFVQIFGMVVIFVIMLFVVIFIFTSVAWMSTGFEKIMSWDEWAHVVILGWSSFSGGLHLAFEALAESKESTEELVDWAWSNVRHKRMHVNVLNFVTARVMVALSPAVSVVLFVVKFLFLLLKLFLLLFELMLLLFKMSDLLLKTANFILHLVLGVSFLFHLLAEDINLMLEGTELKSKGQNYANENQYDKTCRFTNEIKCLLYRRLVSFFEKMVTFRYFKSHGFHFFVFIEI